MHNLQGSALGDTEWTGAPPKMTGAKQLQGQIHKLKPHIQMHVLTSHLAQASLLFSSKDSFTFSVTFFFSSSTAFKYLARLLELKINRAS